MISKNLFPILRIGQSDDQAILDDVLATPEAAKRAATELGRGQHLDMLDRIFPANSGNSYKAIREYIGNLDSHSLNHVAENLSQLEYLESPDLKGRMLNASAVLRGIAERSGELTGEGRLSLTQETLRIQLDSFKDKCSEMNKLKRCRLFLKKAVRIKRISYLMTFRIVEKSMIWLKA